MAMNLDSITMADLEADPALLESLISAAIAGQRLEEISKKKTADWVAQNFNSINDFKRVTENLKPTLDNSLKLSFMGKNGAITADELLQSIRSTNPHYLKQLTNPSGDSTKAPISNPWMAENRNVTQRMLLMAQQPEIARRLMLEAGVQEY